MSGTLTINSNLASLGVQRRLGESTKALEQCYTRLSSGLRINRASDDAAGLSIASMLRTDVRVFTQGKRNINDAVSLLNIADGVLESLGNIALRQKELATQAASETLSVAQRNAIQQEVDALSTEFQRVMASTSFNNGLVAGGCYTLLTQAGYGPGGGIPLEFGAALAAGRIGGGLFQSLSTEQAGDTVIAAGDVNNDGNADFITSDSKSNGHDSVLFLGHGDGSFERSANAIDAGNDNVLSNGTFADLNSDGKLDLIAGAGGLNEPAAEIFVCLGNGDGSFSAACSYATADYDVRSIDTCDFNHDGVLDVMTTGTKGAGTTSVLLGVGDGTFGAARGLTAAGDPEGSDAVDVNNDGNLDIVTLKFDKDLQDDFFVYLGNGNGTFAAARSFSYSEVEDFSMHDINHDGKIDIVGVQDENVKVFYGSGNGSFAAPQVVASTQSIGGTQLAAVMQIADVDNDGRDDIIAQSDGGAFTTLVYFRGNAQGSFNAVSPLVATGGYGSSVAGISRPTADFNNDGVLDYAGATVTTGPLYFMGMSYYFEGGDPAILLGSPMISVQTPQGAKSALDKLSQAIKQIDLERATVGAHISRLETANNVLDSARLNSATAQSQITDADVAGESAQLVKQKILQQIGTSILAQANQLPALALTLLKG
jgi:flagellin